MTIRNWLSAAFKSVLTEGMINVGTIKLGDRRVAKDNVLKSAQANPSGFRKPAIKYGWTRKSKGKFRDLFTKSKDDANWSGSPRGNARRIKNAMWREKFKEAAA